LKFYFFALVCSMCGLIGHVLFEGSLFLNKLNGQTLLMGIRALQQVGDSDSNKVYWQHIAARAEFLHAPIDGPENLAFARLLCLTRTNERKGFEKVESAWKQMSDNEREAFTEIFLADGLTDKAFIFKFLPDYLANASKNEGVGMYRAIIILLDLLDDLKEKKVMQQAMSMTVTIDIADLAAIVNEVRTAKAMTKCIEYANIIQQLNTVSVCMTGRSWSAATSTKAERTDDVKSMLQHINTKQDAIVSMIEDAMVGGGQLDESRDTLI